MRRLAVVIFIVIAVMLQVSIFSRIQILSGKLDLILLMVIAWALQPEISVTDIVLFSILTGLIIGFISAEPIWLLVSIYLFSAFFSIYLKNRFIQIPILIMFLSGFIFSFFHLFISMLVFQISGLIIDFKTGLEIVIMPSLLLSIIASLPVYLMVSELRRLTFPSLEEI
jgi:hypothetical protein